MNVQDIISGNFEKVPESKTEQYSLSKEIGLLLETPKVYTKAQLKNVGRWMYLVSPLCALTIWSYASHNIEGFYRLHRYISELFVAPMKELINHPELDEYVHAPGLLTPEQLRLSPEEQMTIRRQKQEEVLRKYGYIE